jgi:hypothetical protein
MNKNIILNHPYISSSINIQYEINPFKYLIIDNLLDPLIYKSLCLKFPKFIQRTIPYKDQPGATSNYEGYISGLAISDCQYGYDFFISQELKVYIEKTFDIETTQYMSPSAHFHKSPSKSGFVHRDANICNFKKSIDSNITTISKGCSYTDDISRGVDTIKVMRSIAFLYYLNNPSDLSKHIGGGTGIYDKNHNLLTEIKPVNNRLFIFEICHNSYHGFIGANFDRSAVVNWYHSSPAYIINRYWKQYCKMIKNNQSFVERWSTSSNNYWPIEDDPEYNKYFNSPLSSMVGV